MFDLHLTSNFDLKTGVKTFSDIKSPSEQLGFFVPPAARLPVFGLALFPAFIRGGRFLHRRRRILLRGLRLKTGVVFRRTTAATRLQAPPLALQLLKLPPAVVGLEQAEVALLKALRGGFLRIFRHFGWVVDFWRFRGGGGGLGGGGELVQGGRQGWVLDMYRWVITTG